MQNLYAMEINWFKAATSSIPFLIRLTVCGLQLLLLISLAVSTLLSTLSSRRQPLLYGALGPSHRLAQWICGLLCILFLLPPISEIWQHNGDINHVPPEEIGYFIMLSASWLAILIILRKETEEAKSFRLRFLQAWWLACLILYLVWYGTWIAELQGNGWPGAIVSDFQALVFLVTLPLLLFLVCTSFSGSLYRKCTNDDIASITEPFLEQHSNTRLTDSSLRFTGFNRAGIISKLTFSWLVPLLETGNRKPLEMSDIPHLGPEDGPDINSALFQAGWNMQLKPGMPSSPSVWRALWLAFWRPFLYASALAIVYVCMMFAGPVLLNRFVSYIQSDKRSQLEGYGLVLILFCAKILETSSDHQFNFHAQVLGIKMLTGVGSAVYRKTLCLSHKARCDKTVGQILNILSTDVQRLLPLSWYLLQGLTLPLQIVIALCILFYAIGVAMIAGLLTMLLIVGLSVVTASKFRSFRMKALRAKDDRMKGTTESLSNMKVIKLQSWEEYFCKKIEELRKEELRWVARFLYTLSVNIFFMWLGPLAVSVVTFLTMFIIGEELTTARVFTAITTFRILQEPLRTTPDVISYVTQAIVSVQRIHAFLSEDELDMNAVEKLEEDSELALEIKEATFVWDLVEAVPAIKNITLSVKKGDCVAICGVVGSGKSNLLSCILGELPKVNGTVKLVGRVAYVSQSPWLQNKTIQENILFGLPMDQKRYEEAIKVSGLVADLKQFPYGDTTEIGERGINMSGGQKQRIQLARAVYQDADIYLLDDPFSAVDAHTGSYLFKECIRGALRKKTVILVTHQVEFLPSTDSIVVLRDGEIVQSGSYSQLVQEGRDFGAFVKALHSSLNSVLPGDEVQEKGEINLEAKVSIKRMDSLVTDTSSLALENFGSKKGLTQSNSLKGLKVDSFQERTLSSKQKTIAQSGMLIQEEERETGRVSSSVYWKYVTKFSGGLLVPLIILLQILTQGLQVGGDTWLAKGTSDESMIRNWSFIGIYAAMAFGCALGVFLRTFLVSFVGISTAQLFFLDMLRRVFRAPISFFDTTPIGRILSRASTDQSRLDMDLPLLMASTINNIFAVLSVVLVVSSVTWQILFIVLPLGYVYIRLQVYYITCSRELSRVYAMTEAPVIHHFGESIAGATTIRAFGVQQRFLKTNEQRFDAYQRSYFHSIAAQEWLGLWLEVIGTMVVSAAAFLLIQLPRNTIAPGSVGLSLSYGLALNASLVKLIMFASTAENEMISVERISQYTNIPSEAPVIIPDRRPPAEWPQEGKIEAKNLKVRYRPDTPLVLKGVSFVIHPCEKVGVVGRTGSGKSTLVLLLFRLVEPANGQILIDDLDICTIGLSDLRSRLSIVPQEPTLFEGSVRSNLDPLNVYSDRLIWEVISVIEFYPYLQFSLLIVFSKSVFYASSSLLNLARKDYTIDRK
ncbi:hypothetical protein O6H91_03G050700 [Diphasiastrum complanatum]|uniref:Uncharacterized protein n=1 Tax=Diphasiastrum complanatum TaxID=34168 RepID=A0ACC2E637_DIPCM|nr:hypothetical protein O6H91_03G050700 [Diphasiastrum complanatum]